MPNTRGAAKRLHGEITNAAHHPPAKGQKKRKQTVSQSSLLEKVETKESKRCRLLELPAELRNRIYDFTNEGSDSSAFEYPPYAPRMQKIAPHMTATKWAERPWQSFGLTQTCKQLRAEYRPLWIRDLSIRLVPTTIASFMAAFVPVSAQQDQGPTLVQISWCHGRDNLLKERGDLTSLLQLRARFPYVRLQYVPYRVADLKWGPVDDMCEELNDMADHGYNIDSFSGYCTCHSEDMTYEDWVEFEENRMGYMKVVKDFISNNNEEWHTDILAEQMTVEFSFIPDMDDLTFRILCKDTIGTNTKTFGAARDLLKTWGIFDLPCKNDMSLILAFEEEREKKIGGYNMKKSVVREVRVPKPIRKT